MKIQDLLFLAVFIFLFVRQNPRFFVIAGIVSLFLSIPLFSLWIFFTAERLTWYAGAFFIGAITLHILKTDNFSGLRSLASGYLKSFDRLIDRLNRE